MKDDILEESHSSYINPLRVVQREGKSPRICVDARKVTQRVIPPSTYEISMTKGKIRGEYNKKALKSYLEEETADAVGGS
jgi:hypothetical protein